MTSDVIDSHRVRELLIEGGSGRIFDRRIPHELYHAPQQPNGHGASIFFDHGPVSDYSGVRIYSFIPADVVRKGNGYIGETNRLTDALVDYVTTTYLLERSFRRALGTVMDTSDTSVKPVPTQFPTLEKTILLDKEAVNFLNGLSLLLHIHEGQAFAELLKNAEGDEEKLIEAKVELYALIARAEGRFPPSS